MPENSGEQFLHQKNPTLHTSNEVKHEMDRKILAKEKVSQKPADKISDWLKVLEQTHMNHENDSRVQNRIKNYYHNLIITPHKEKLAAAATNVEERAARTLGIDAQYGEEQLDQRGDIAIKDLESSLDQWLDYLSSKDQTYPMWFRYYVFTNIIQLSDFDKDQEKFPKRTKDTVRLFPEIDRGALAHVLDIIKASRDDEALNNITRAQKMVDTPEHNFLTKQKAILFANKSFADQYAEAIKLNGYITSEMRAETRGKWVKYKKGSDPTPLWQSLQNKGTSWCTKGYETAKTQLQAGDFYVYYTDEKVGKPTIPRIAIRMQGDEIFEVRGVADKGQNLEGNMTEIAKEKLQTLPNPEKFEKKVSDMKQLTQIENKVKNSQELSKEELKFIYEIDSNIEGFGYEKDPRIKEIKNKRDIKKDLTIVYDCSLNQIVDQASQITKDTLICLGSLDKGDVDMMNNHQNPLIIFGDADFKDCTSLTSIPENTTFNGYANFKGCTSLASIPENTTFNGHADFRGCNLSDKLKEQLQKMKNDGKIKGGLYL